VGNSHQKTSPACRLVTSIATLLGTVAYSSLLHWLTPGCRIFRALFFQGNGVRLKAVIVPRWNPNMCLSRSMGRVCLEWLVSNSPFPGAARPGLAGQASMLRKESPSTRASISPMEQGPTRDVPWLSRQSTLRKLINSASCTTTAFLTSVCFLHTQSCNRIR
jgi:hypothetical protein